MVDRFMGADRVVTLPVVAKSGVTVTSRDRTVRPLEADRQRFTTPEMLAIERHVVRSAKARRGEDAARVSYSMVKSALGSRTHLSAEQRALVAAITTSGNGVDVVIGVAGSGKTAALDAARAAWRLAGQRVLGCALAGRRSLSSTCRVTPHAQRRPQSSSIRRATSAAAKKPQERCCSSIRRMPLVHPVP